MAIDLVGSAATGSSDVDGTTIASAAASHTTGNLLVVCVGRTSASGGAVQSVSDTAGNTYSLCAESKNPGASQTEETEVWYAKNITGNASNVITATYSISASKRRIIVLQYSGADLTAPYETGEYEMGSGTSITSGSFSPAASGNVNVACAFTDDTTTYSAGTNYVSRGQVGTIPLGSMDRIGAPSGAQTATMNSSGNNLQVMSVGSFKVESGGAAGWLQRNYWWDNY